jgi:hypothetical protein
MDGEEVELASRCGEVRCKQHVVPIGAEGRGV